MCAERSCLKRECGEDNHGTPGCLWRWLMGCDGGGVVVVVVAEVVFGGCGRDCGRCG